MWISINYMINHLENINTICLIGFFIWVGLSILFYYIASKLLKNKNN
jgi:hypothetical protein